MQGPLVAIRLARLDADEQHFLPPEIILDRAKEPLMPSAGAQPVDASAPLE
jgi:hypothetical protein